MDNTATFLFLLLGPFYGAIAVLSVTRCRCCRRRRRCCGHRCAGGVRQQRHLVNGNAACCGSQWQMGPTFLKCFLLSQLQCDYGSVDFNSIYNSATVPPVVTIEYQQEVIPCRHSAPMAEVREVASSTSYSHRQTRLLFEFGSCTAL